MRMSGAADAYSAAQARGVVALVDVPAGSRGQAQPRPIKGIFVAVMVRNCTLASSGRPAM
jgi:hypothetical protein